jgi:hypothetical protein
MLTAKKVVAYRSTYLVEDDGIEPSLAAYQTGVLAIRRIFVSPRGCFSRGRESIALWSAWQGSNLRHSVCKTGTRTTELHAVRLEAAVKRRALELWWKRSDLNRQPSLCKSVALPLSYNPVWAELAPCGRRCRNRTCPCPVSKTGDPP